MSENELTGAQVTCVTWGDNELPRPKDQPHTFYAKVREMRKDPTVALARALSIAPILAAQWSYEQENDAPVGAQEFISRMLAPLRFHILRSSFFGCIDFGWQAYEKIFEIREDGMCYLRKLKPLLQDITDILVDVDTGAFIGVKQEEFHHPSRPQGVALSVDKCLLLNIDVEGSNWYGESVMSIVEGPYDSHVKSNAGSERYDQKLAGSHWVIHYPQGQSKIDGSGEEVDNFIIAKRIIARLESSGAIAVPRQIAQHLDSMNESSPDSWKIELINDPGGQQTFMERMRYLDALKCRAFGLPERAVIEGQFGTKAEAEAHADIAILNMEARHMLIAQQINWHLVNQLLRYNYGPQAENKVYIQPAAIADLEKSWLRDLYTKIISDPNGFLTELDGIDLEALRDRVGIPVKPATNVDTYGVTGDSTAIEDTNTLVFDIQDLTTWPMPSDPTLTPSTELAMSQNGRTLRTRKTRII